MMSLKSERPPANPNLVGVASDQHAWHALEANEVAHILNSNVSAGLSVEEVDRRRAQYGANTVEAAQSRTAWRILLDQFLSVVVLLLAVAALLSAVTGEAIEAAAIVVVLFINAAVGFATEWKAGRALEALRKQARTLARVRRDRHEQLIDAEELVPGDVVLLSAGDRVPADSRLIEAPQLSTEESALTGESTVVQKSVGPVNESASLPERYSMVYMGTGVASGRALAMVVATGTHTELGKVGKLVAGAKKEESPLEQRLGELGRRLVYLVLVIAAVVMFAGWLRGDGTWLMIEVGISLAVAAVPEGLPAVTTLILALGVLRMAKRRAIVRRLAAVETLGSATVICSDKTGTLTENRMTVREYFLSDGRSIDLTDNKLSTQDDELLARAVRIGVLSNEASFEDGLDGQPQTLGDPTETALLVVADALVFDVKNERRVYPKVAEQPFDAATKRMTTVHRRTDGRHFAALKGAPTVVLAACSEFVAGPKEVDFLTDEKRAQFLLANEKMARRAMRVLGLAVKHFDEKVVDHSNEDELEGGFTFLGLVGMIDPPRAGVAEAIEEAHGAGIRTIMLTGDQLHTAVAIARELGLSGSSNEPRAIHADELSKLNAAELERSLRTTTVFARVSPADKLRIVKAFQSSGEIVAVTGDGVNDAPALKQANIGVAMGERGTEVAKESADLVLADDNFATIVNAVEGGRAIYANIVKFVHMMFSHNLGEVLMIFVAITAGMPLPLLPLQILWMNIVTDVFPALALAVEPPSPDTMRIPPRRSHTSLFSKPFLILIGWQSAMLAAIALALYVWALRAYGAGSHAQTIALFGLIGVQLGHLFNCRSQTRSAFVGLSGNPFVWVAAAAVIALQLLAVYVSPLARVLQTVEPTARDWFAIAICSLLPIAIVELTKAAASWRHRKPIPAHA